MKENRGLLGSNRYFKNSPPQSIISFLTGRSGRSGRRPNRTAEHNQGGRNRFYGAPALVLPISFFLFLSACLIFRLRRIALIFAVSIIPYRLFLSKIVDILFVRSLFPYSNVPKSSDIFLEILLPLRYITSEEKARKTGAGEVKWKVWNTST